MSGDYPREPVPEEAANRPARSIAMIVANAVMGVPVMILGISIGADYGQNRGWLVIVLGCALTAAFAALVAHAGVRSRRSAALLSREAFGSSGAHFLNLAIAVALLGWFAVEMGFIGAMVGDGLKSVVGLDVGRSPGIIVASLLICAISVFGIALISRAPLLFLPLLAALLLTVIFLTFQSSGVSSFQPFADKSIGSGVSSIVGAYIVGCLIMPDYSRFVRTSRAAIGATIIALGPVYGLVLGTYAVAGLVTQSSQPSAILLALGLPAIIGLLLPIGLMQNGIMCLYSSSLATSTFLKSTSFKTIAIATMLVGMGMALAGADSFFVNFLVILGIIFPPAAALLIDAGLFRQLLPEAKAWQWSSLAVWCFGIACGCASEWLGVGMTGFSAFDGCLGAAAGAAVLHMTRKANVTNATA